MAAADSSKAAETRTTASNVLSLTETIGQDPIGFSYGHIDRISFGELVALASIFANGHIHPDDFQKELKRAIERGLDDVTFQRFADRWLSCGHECVFGLCSGEAERR